MEDLHPNLLNTVYDLVQREIARVTLPPVTQAATPNPATGVKKVEVTPTK